MANWFRLLRLTALVALALATPARADGIDCQAARTPIERAICDFPALLDADRTLAHDFSAALAREPDRAADLRRDELAWLKARNATCGPLADTAARTACLLASYTQRLAQLAPTPVVAAGALPAADLPPPPAVALPEAAATLDTAILPAAARMETLLHVTAAGRFAIDARSASGTALQLVDMLTGPGNVAGDAGSADGRIDALLEQGTYKLRAYAAPGATGDVTLSVTPFRDAAPPRTLDFHARLDTELSDLQQLRFWFAAKPDTPIRIEAAGRALADVKLWRNGTDLVSLAPDVRDIEPTRGHPLTDFLFRGTLEPGTYLLTTYGGKPLARADGTNEQPFHLRAAASDALQAGEAAGTIGPFGSELFSLARLQATSLRLDLPQPADAGLAFAVKGAVAASAAIMHTAREPVARITVPGARDNASAVPLVEVAGAEGQAFRLRRETAPPGMELAERSGGDFWVSADAAGFGGDEPPATALFLRRTPNQPDTLAGALVPRVGPGQAWRQRFNLRGQVALLFEVAAGGPIALRAEGVAVAANVAPIGGSAPPRADGKKPGLWELAAGWYRLVLTPPAGAAGILDVTLGPPGLLPDRVAAAQPTDPALPLGRITLAPNERLILLAGGARGAQIGLAARAAPVDFSEGPLTVTQSPGVALDVPVSLPGVGALVAREIGGGPVEVAFVPGPTPATVRIGMAHVPAPDHPRSVALSWSAPPQRPEPVPPPTPPAALEALGTSAPRFVDLGRDEQRSFALSVPEGGLFRIETLGRLATAGQIGTPFIPDLDDAEGNGIGRNFLIQRFLRAGDYRVRVATRDSAGRLGVAVRPAPVASGAALVPGGSVRAALAADQGIVFPIDIPTPGKYHFDLLSLARGLTARLEDAQGWPLLAAGDLSSLDQDFAPGSYRLLVQPAGIAARVVARLDRVEAPAAHVGHGPFPLAFDTTGAATWREPPGRDDPRAPDLWTFVLAGPAAVSLKVSEGMVADLLAEGSEAPTARFTADAPYDGTLPAGGWRVRTESLGRNDRLDYTLSLASEELQPGVPRPVALPGHEKFAIAADRVVSLTTFGRIPLRAVLRRADGHVVERVGDRGTDWNIGLSRLLPAGAYTLDLASAAPEKGEPVQPADTDQPPPADAPDATAGNGTVELRLALPEEHAPVAVATEGMTELTGGGVHHLLLPPSPPGALSVVATTSSADLVLALERRDFRDAWQTVTVARGTTPVVGGLDSAPEAGGSDGAAFRLSVWTLDGGAEPIRVAVRVLDPPSVAPGEVTPTPLNLSGLPQSLAVARIALQDLAPLRVAGAAAGLEAVSTPFSPLTPVSDGLILPQTRQLWLLARDRAGPIALAPVSIAPGQPLALTLPPDRAAVLSAPAPAIGRVRIWLAESGAGQPRLDAGPGMGVAPGSALALACGCQPVTLSNAEPGEGQALPVRVAALDLAEVSARALDANFAETLPPLSALPLHLPEQVHRLRLDLAPGTAAIANWRGPHAVTVWTGRAAVSRTVEGDVADVLLVNTGADPAPAAVAWTAGDAPALSLRPGAPLKRFFGAAGSLDVPVAGVDVTKDEPRLTVVGGTATLFDAFGPVERGASVPIFGTGRVIIDHGPGLLAAWIEGGDVPPWPEAAPQATSLPAHLALHDAAITLALAPVSPMVLHASTTAPVILALGDEPAMLFAAGADLSRYLPAGPQRMKIISPHDGPLAGTLDLTADPVTEATEGIGATVAVAPGGTAAFSFRVARAGPIGLGVRAEPDDITVRLLDAAGKPLGEGVAQLRTLAPGTYVLEARVPPDAPATLLRPTLVGLAPKPNGPPKDVVNAYLELAGRAPIPAAAKGTAP